MPGAGYSSSLQTIETSAEALTVTPLGGCQEVGLNATLVGFGKEALLIDCGVLLGSGRAYGVEKYVPDFSSVFSSGRSLRAVLLTHGHEDHIGGLFALLRMSSQILKEPLLIYGTPWTLVLARSRVEQHGFSGSATFCPVSFGTPFQVGPFSSEFIHVTHSIPDSAAVFVQTPAGSVLHSGDFKLDASPLSESPSDVSRLKALGEQGVDVLLSDSTNSEAPGCAGSESQVEAGMAGAMSQVPGRIVIALFASHIHRLQMILSLARKEGRSVCFLGRSLHEQGRLAERHGWLEPDAGLRVDESNLGAVARNRTLILTTGAQGEPYSGLARIAEADSGRFLLQSGDRVVLSARTIPGNELRVRAILNRISARGASLVRNPAALVHCSGHAHQDEQRSLLRMVRPKSFVPIHGDRTMLEAHAETARQSGLPANSVLVLANGETAIWSGQRLSRGESQAQPRIALDMDHAIVNPMVLKARRNLGFSGIVGCSVVLGRVGHLLQSPCLSFRGFSASPELQAQMGRCVIDALEKPECSGSECEAVVKAVLGRFLKSRSGAVPVIEVQVIRTEI